MTPGARVAVTGALCTTGTVKLATETVLVIEETPGLVLHLRRDVASTRPLAWRYRGMEVAVTVTGIRGRLEALAAATCVCGARLDEENFRGYCSAACAKEA